MENCFVLQEILKRIYEWSQGWKVKLNANTVLAENFKQGRLNIMGMLEIHIKGCGMSECMSGKKCEMCKKMEGEVF